MREQKSLRNYRTAWNLILISILLIPGTLLADGDIHFVDVSAEVGIQHENMPSGRIADREDIFASLPIPTAEFLSEVRPNYALKPRGVPGVAILDFDGDGDQDVYVTNAEGAANGLYSNQLRETGEMSFIDVASQAGADATHQDTCGICYGDIDNDGDVELYLLGVAGPNLLLLNNGDGTFSDITAVAGVAGDDRNPASCAFGDVDNDGLLDLAVANTYDDWIHNLGTLPGPTYPGFEHNQLFLNQGGHAFHDVSASSGIEDVSNMSGPGLSGAAHTWAISLVDYDLDGDLDLVSADNQGPAPTAGVEEERRGWIRIFNNDGTGHFEDVTVDVGLDNEGGWMGLTFGDYNCDGSLDFFSTNVGDYGGPDRHSTLYFGDGSGQFTFAGPSQANPFGWGTSSLDYDNDGDLDIVYQGGLDLLNILFMDNPGVVFNNQGDCSGEMIWDSSALEVDHRNRTVEGVATGDLNGDGFSDIVSASSFDIVPNGFVLPFTLLTGPLDPAFDEVVALLNVLPGSIMPGFVVEGDPDLQLPNGSLVLELNSANNGNRWAKVTLRGSVGTLATGRVNRSGIGAVVSLTPKHGNRVMRPLLGGSSYASQDSLEQGFGLGAARKGLVEVLWPGGVTNRVKVRAGESLLFPEIPCDYSSRFENFPGYVRCVVRSLSSLSREQVLRPREVVRFFKGALSCTGNVDRICVRGRNR